MGFLKRLIPLAIVLGLGYCMWTKRGDVAPATDATPAADAAAPAADSAPATDGGTPAVDGTVPALDAAATPGDAGADAGAAADSAATPAPTADGALGALQAGNLTTHDLIKALNLTGIQFEPVPRGSAPPARTSWTRLPKP
ncbi:MAG TPA: hypothetical protein VIT22_12870 [Pseudoxanthomonas sp.]